MNSTDTIVAISSAVGEAARMIVRISGGEAHRLAGTLGIDPVDVGARRQTATLRGMRFPAWIYVFRSPRSYTGENLVELHLPGNPLLAKWAVESLMSAGARPAEAGEFTARAYFNSKIDLTKAEGIAATIAAQNEQELAAARQLAAGELTRRLRPPMDRLAETLALIEVGIDFSEEEVTFLSGEQLARRIHEIDDSLRDLINQSARFERLSHEPRIVLVGRPNAGKSTLLNRLAGHDRAVVSPVAGTTRDAISARVALKRGFVQVVDVAGLEETEPDDEIERQMHRRALRELEQADRVLMLIDAADARPPLAIPRAADLAIRTKIDLGSPSAGNNLAVSALTGENITALLDTLDHLAFGSIATSSTLALNTRHLRSIGEARVALTTAMRQIGVADELIAFELRHALDALGQVLGMVSPDDLYDRIFSTFCIGK
jgi:tRNA modification GTPase